MQEQITKIFDVFNKYGFEGYIVGGFVRDLINGEEPHDTDFATNANPDQIIEIFENEGYKTVPTGIEHGTITIIVDDEPFQVTTYRADKKCDGRHCDVEFVNSLEEDIKRRDFTINGLAMDQDDNIIDLVNGIQDIQDKIVRAIGDPIDRFSNLEEGGDYLRMLRAIRLATQKDFDIEENTLNAIKELYQNLAEISRDRIRDEFSKILLAKKRTRGVLMLYDTGMLDIIIPNFSELEYIDQPEQYHPEGDVLTHSILALDKTQENDPLHLILATLLHDKGKVSTQIFDPDKGRYTFIGHDIVGAKDVRDDLENLNFSADIIDNVIELIESHMYLHQDVSKMKKSTIKRMMLKATDGFAPNPLFEDMLKLLKYDIEASSNDFENYNILLERVAQLREELIRRPPVRLINGYDVMNLGIKPGPIIADIIRKVEDAQLEGQIITREEALEYLKNIIVSINTNI